MQSADLVLNPNTTGTIRLMLDRDGVKRPWKRVRTPRHLEAIQGSRVESSVFWDSFHGGDGYSWITGTGQLPPLTAEGNLDCRFPHRMTLPPKMTAIDSTTDPENTSYIFVSGAYLFVVGRSGTNYLLYKFDASTLAFDSSTTLGGIASTGLIWPPTKFDDVWYVPYTSGTGNLIATVTDGVVATDNTIGWTYSVVSRDKFFIVIGGELKSIPTGQDPLNETVHSGAITYADASATITGLASQGRVVFIGMTNGLQGLDDELNLVSLIPDLDSYNDSENCRGMISWHSGLFIPHQKGWFFYVDGGAVAPIGLDRTRFNRTNLRGEVLAALADGEYIWVLLYAPASSSGGTKRGVLLRGRERGQQEPGFGPLIWHEVQEWTQSNTPNAPFSMYIQSGSDTLSGDDAVRVWFPQAGNASYILSENKNMAPRTNSGNFASSGYKILPAVNMNAPMTIKYLRRVVVDVDDASINQPVSIYYTTNPEDAYPTWTLLNSITQTGRTDLPFPRDVYCRDVQLKVEMSTNDATTSPIVRRIELFYSDREKQNTLFTGVYKVGPDVVDNDGLAVDGDAETILNSLYDLQEGEESVNAIDHMGNDVYFLVLDVQDEEIESSDGKDTYTRITLTLEQVVHTGGLILV